MAKPILTSPSSTRVQEIQVQTSNYSAKYGTTGGAVINAVTKSGTSTFHGNAYEYFRNDKMDARNFFSPTVVPIKQNEFGFSIGGPVILPHYNKNRNKTFFFWNENWRYRRSATTITTATPPLRCAPAILPPRPRASRNPFSTRAPGSHSPAT